MLERLELREFDEYISVLYRPNHDYLMFLDKDKNYKEVIKNLINMSREEFIEFLKQRKNLMPITEYSLKVSKESSKEEWYLKGWSMNTNNILNELNLINPIEKPILTKELEEVI